jgi:hypothetical protein
LVKLERLEIILFNAFAYNGTGCSDLGFMYKEGKGVKQDDSKALKFYQKACDLKKSSCLTPLPLSYTNPRREQPLPSFKSHAFWKNLSGCFNLGLIYEEGKGVKQDDFKALKFHQKACDLNDGNGCFVQD